MNLEDELRVTLRDRAADAAPRPDLLGGVREGVAVDRRRRRTVAVTAAALALAGVVAVPVVAGQRSRDVRPPAVTPTTASPAPRWNAPSWAPPEFPLRPAEPPAGMGDPVVHLMGPNVRLHYERGASVLSAEIGPVQPGWEVEGEREHSATVGGRPATVRTSSTYDGAGPRDRYVGVRWRTTDGRWLQVLSLGPRTEADVLRFARGLAPARVRPAPPLTFTEVPPGLTLQHQSAELTCLNTVRAARTEYQPTGICLSVTAEPSPPDGEPETVTVDGRPAKYYPYAASLQVDLGGGRWLVMDWEPAEFVRGADDWLRLAAAVRVRG